MREVDLSRINGCNIACPIAFVKSIGLEFRHDIRRFEAK